MSDINPIKQAPVQGMTGLGGGPSSLLCVAPPLDSNVYVDDVFSTSVYTGSGGNRTITNGIDLAGEGGMVWSKVRNDGYSHALVDSARGASKVLRTERENPELTASDMVTAFNSNGYSLGSDANGYANYNNTKNYVSWTFRKAPGFFDVVTYTGTGSTQTIAHNLESVPGCIIVKARDSSENWSVYHRGSNTSSQEDYKLLLNTNDGRSDSQSAWNDTAPTSTQFTIGTDAEVNGNGITYVAYLFGHNAQSFGVDGDKPIIWCGNFSGNGSDDGPAPNFGFEPQWILWKRANGTANWAISDTTRGIIHDKYADPYLLPDVVNAEGTSASQGLQVTPTGFKVRGTSDFRNGSGDLYLYIAIRRPDGYVGRPATTGTDVFNQVTGVTGPPSFVTAFTADMGFYKGSMNAGTNWQLSNRITGTDVLQTDTSAAAGDGGTNMVWDHNNGYSKNNSSSQLSSVFKRHAGFDVVCWNGSSGNKTLNHSLGRTPEMIWAKARSESQSWLVYHKGLNGGTNPWSKYVTLDGTGAEANWAAWVQAPTSTQFSIISNWNASSQNYIAMLFASVDGISKVGSYTGNGSTSGPTVTLGFSPRFVLIKNREGTGNWVYPWSISGWPFGDRYMYLNSDAAENNTGQTVIDKTSTSFTITTTDSDFNTNGEGYIYYAHA